MKPLIESWENPTSSIRNEIVFANRNHLYGAYALRQNYEKLVAKAFILTSTAFIILFFIPVIIKWLNPTEVISTNNNDEVWELTQDVFKKPEEIAAPTKTPPPASAALRSPIPVINDEVINEEPLPLNQNSNTNVSVNNNISDSIFIDDYVPGSNINADTITHTITDVQEIPAFPGGISAMMNYLIANIHYPYNAKESNIHGTVYISFVIDKEGSLTDVNVMRGIGGGCDEEALRVVKSMPAWTPGKQNGRSVMVRLILPVQFTLR